MKCTRCEKNEATAKFDITPLKDETKKMHAFLCEQCGIEVIELLFSCTCHIKEKDA